MSLATFPSGRDLLSRSTVVAPRAPRWHDYALALAQRLYPDYELQREEAEKADTWLRAKNELPILPQDQWAPDYKKLQEASAGSFIRVAIAEMTQCLYVEGHIASDAKERKFSKTWERIWQPNRMDGRQVAVHRSALAHGVAYMVAEKATETFTGKPTVSLRGVSALSGCAIWRTTEVTEFPEAFIEVRTETDENGNELDLVQIYDETHVYTLHRHGQTSPEGAEDWTAVDRREHGASVVPVVAFCNDEDLDGNVMGEITPVIPILKRIDQDTFDRLIVQRFGSWRIRTATGIALPTSPKDRQILEQYLAVNSILATENKDAKFGSIEPTALDGYIAAKDSDLRDFASVLQVPPHHILGLSPNVSAEGLVEAQASLMRKMEERQHLFGESWELLLRLASHILGDTVAASDFSSQVTWRDMESRSLAQIADALGKLAQMLEVPAELLWNRIPNWTQQDTEAALALREAEREAELELLNTEAALSGSSAPSGAAPGSGLDDAERRRINRMRGGRGPDWDGDGKPN